MCKHNHDEIPKVFAEQLMKQDEHVLRIGVQSNIVDVEDQEEGTDAILEWLKVSSHLLDTLSILHIGVDQTGRINQMTILERRCIFPLFD